jgi:hypothetical protein
LTTPVPPSSDGTGNTTDGQRGLEAAARERGRGDAAARLDPYTEGEARHYAAAHLLLLVLDDLLPAHPERVMAAYYEGHVDVIEAVLKPVLPPYNGADEGEGESK